jgi:hypothetical protein
MNESDLDSKLKTLHVPERDADYWEMFPRNVMRRARAVQVPRSRPNWFPRLAWGGSIAFASLMIGLCVSHSPACPLEIASYAVKSAKSFHTEMAQLPKQARALMRIDHGLKKLIEEQP